MKKDFKTFVVLLLFIATAILAVRINDAKYFFGYREIHDTTEFTAMHEGIEDRMIQEFLRRSEKEIEELKEKERKREEEEAKILKPPIKILLVGDSTMLEGFGPELERQLLGLKFQVKRHGVYSSGLTNSTRINWPVAAAADIDSYKPDIVISSMGPNDGQDIFTSQGRFTPWSNEWEGLYEQKVENYIRTIFATETPPRYLILVGQPNPESAEFRYKFTKINRVFKKYAEAHDKVLFIDSWDRFSINGNYSNLIADDNGVVAYSRHSDGVHLTRHGSAILSGMVIKSLHEIAEF